MGSKTYEIRYSNIFIAGLSVPALTTLVLYFTFFKNDISVNLIAFLVLFGLAILFLASWLVVLILKMVYVSRVFNKLPKQKLDLTQTKLAQSSVWRELSPDYLASGSQADVIRASEVSLYLLNYQEKFRLYLARFEIYKRDQRRRQRSGTAYYTVFEADLQRAIPQVVFDAKMAKKKQFKRVYAQSQRVSLDPPGNDYFEVYSPLYHNIETFSFITPEVIAAAIEAKEYDFEVIDNKLLVYGPLLDEASLRDFEIKARNIFYHLDDNLRAYGGSRQAKNKSDFNSIRLLKTPRPLVFSSIFITLFLLYSLITDFFSMDNLFFAIMGGAIWFKIYQQVDENKRNANILAIAQMAKLDNLAKNKSSHELKTNKHK